MSNQLSNYVRALRKADFHHENNRFRAAFFPWGLIKTHLLMQRHKRGGFHPWVGKIPWRRAWQPTPVFLPGESPWAEELSGLRSIGSQRVGHYWSDLAKGQRCVKHMGDRSTTARRGPQKNSRVLTSCSVHTPRSVGLLLRLLDWGFWNPRGSRHILSRAIQSLSWIIQTG